LKGYLINDVCIFVETILQVYHEYKKLPKGSNFASSARGQRYYKIDIFAPQFTPLISTCAHANFLSENQVLQKIEVNLVG